MTSLTLLLSSGGVTIQQIQDLANVHCEIAAKSAHAGSKVRGITVTGSTSQIEYCRKLITMKLEGQDLPVKPITVCAVYKI